MQLKHKYVLLCEEEEEVKGQLSEQHQESGKLETEDKVCTAPLPCSLMAPPPSHSITRREWWHEMRVSHH